MKHDEIFELFKMHFSNYIGTLEEWFPNGKDSIRVRFADGRDYIYTVSENGFSFESKESFIDKLKS